jgi:toluene monooxygenase system ferredoxin subunit
MANADQKLDHETDPPVGRLETPVCAASDLWVGEMRGIEIEGHDVLLVNLGGAVSAFADRCLHQGVRLSAGRLRGCVLTCAAHEWQYDARTGVGINPEGVALRRYPLEIRDGKIWIDLDGKWAP